MPHAMGGLQKEGVTSPSKAGKSTSAYHNLFITCMHMWVWVCERERKRVRKRERAGIQCVLSPTASTTFLQQPVARCGGPACMLIKGLYDRQRLDLTPARAGHHNITIRQYLNYMGDRDMMLLGPYQIWHPHSMQHSNHTCSNVLQEWI